MNKKLTYLFLAIVIVFSSCRKDIDITTPLGGEDSPIPPSIIVTSGLVGTVTDENNTPLEGVTLRVKTNTVTTDENGNFNFSNIQMEADGALVIAEKEGFFKAFDRVSATMGATSFTRIQLLDRTILSSFPASAAEVVSFDGAKVKFQNNGFVDSNGADYTGNVNVAAHWIDPTSNTIEQEMPGDLRAIDADNVYSLLQTFGMVAVDLVADNGSDLHLKDGITAEINFPIPTELLNNAPATIPLWSFDEVNGYWVEEGLASKIGDQYVGNVTHFSFWNCDAPFPLIELEGQLFAQEGAALPGVKVCIDFADESLYGACAYTNDEGFFGGKIPSNENLILTVKNSCGNIIFTMDIGPFTENTDLGQIGIPNLSELFIQISGSLVDCGNAPVENGYVSIFPTNNNFPVEIDGNGNFSYNALVCDSDSITVVGYDINEFLSSDPVTASINTNGDPIDIGVLSACGNELEEFIIAVADGVTTNFTIPVLDITEDLNETGYSLGANQIDSTGTFVLAYIVNNNSGITTVAFMEHIDFSSNGENNYICEGTCDVTVNITLDEGPGGFHEGNYSGIAFGSITGALIQVSGSFRVRR